MKFKFLLFMCSCLLFSSAAGLQADMLSEAQKAQKLFIKKFDFTPGWYVQCRSRTTQGCQVAKDAVLSDPGGHRESTIVLLSNGHIAYSIYGEQLPEGTMLDFRREGANIRLNIKLSSEKEAWSFFFKPGLDYLESLNDDVLYILVIDEVTFQSAG